MIVRSLHFAVSIPDTDAAIATIFYPADDSGVDDARLTGLVAADTASAPWPVVIILPGINVEPGSYRWLARRFVEAGFCVVTYQAIGSLGPAGRGITPAMEMAALAPGVLGTRCSATSVEPLLRELANLGDPIAGNVDFSRVALGGHSAGGTIALHNSNPDWIPGLSCVFAVGAHTMSATNLGHDEATITPIAAGVPIMLLAGANDAVIAASRDRYRSDDGAHDPVLRTFDDGVPRDLGDSWFVELAAANHFTMCDPIDETSGRSFLENELAADDRASRELLAEVLVAFLTEHGQDRGSTGVDDAPRVEQVIASAGVSRWSRR